MITPCLCERVGVDVISHAGAIRQYDQRENAFESDSINMSRFLSRSVIPAFSGMVPLPVTRACYSPNWATKASSSAFAAAPRLLPRAAA